MGKCRFPLILSKTIKLDIDLSLVDVRKIEDIPCTVSPFFLSPFMLLSYVLSYLQCQLQFQDENGTIVKGKDGEPMIHTDGTGLISEDLAVRCPENICQGKMLEANQVCYFDPQFL